ncbi:MAG: MBL fold metallo-hydrolase, partial [Beggiatoa sp.]|nr:MBL fold metallo-hydrolase [Beggiatoa sp.]
MRMLPGPKPHNPYFDAAKRHHKPIGFRNNHPRVPPTPEELVRLQRDLGARSPAGAPEVDLSPVAPDLALVQANRTRHTITWIGHSTVLVQTGGRNLITDPMFSRRASPLPFAGPRRHQPPGIALRDLPPIDLV